jgi:hypothetical protein
MMDILNASANFPINQSKIKNSFPKITFEDGSEKIIRNINKKYVIVELMEPLKEQHKFKKYDGKMKMRGVYKTKEEAQERLDKLKEFIDCSNIYIVEKSDEYMKPDPNSLIEKYLEQIKNLKGDDKLLSQYMYQEMMDSTLPPDKKIKFETPTEELFASLTYKLNIALNKRIELEEGKKKRNKFYKASLLVIFIAIISYYILVFVIIFLRRR